MIGFAMCGSFCSHQKALDALRGLRKKNEDILPIVSEAVYNTDTRFGRAKELTEKLEQICGRAPIHTLVEAEALGPRIHLDALIICPCTGNTLAKLAQGITDGTVLMAAKAHLRADRPLILALASNDALSANLKNIGILLNRKHVYFLPMLQDAPKEKPHSLVADFSRLEQTLDAAMRGEQSRKLFL